MGVIKRQSIKQSLVTYFGIVIGAISTLFVYPLLGTERNGEIQFIIYVSALLVPFIGIGIPSVAIHFFPLFKENTERKGRFFFVLLRTTLLSLTFFLTALWFGQDLVHHYFPENAYLFSTYLPYIMGVTFCATIITLLHSYISNYNRIVIPSVIFNLSLKILQPLLVLLCVGGFIAFTQILDGLVVIYAAIVFVTFYYLHYLGHLDINFQKIHTEPGMKRQIIDYALFSIFINVSATLALQIDKLLVGLMLGSTATAIFSVPYLITEAIDVIRKAISGVAAPIVSDSLKSNDIEKVNSIYKKSALLQFVIGMFLLIGAWVCADDLYNLMSDGNKYSKGKILIMILGISRLIDMLTGINTEIIGYSNYYRANLYMLIFMSVINIASIYILTPLYGIKGVALATLISMFCFNAAKLLFIYNKLKIHPLSKPMIGALFIALFTITIGLNIPSFYFDSLGIKLSAIATIAIKGAIMTTCYFLLLWWFKVSNDINQIIDNTVFKTFKKRS